MAMPASVSRRWTRAEVKALTEGTPLQTPRYELVDGELLVTPAPTPMRQAAALELAVALREYLRATGIGEVFMSPADIELAPGGLVQPDDFVVPRDEARRIRSDPVVRILLLVAEVISPGSARGDRGTKRILYQAHVPEYWIVDLDAELFERWRPGDDRPEILRDRIEWHAAGASFPFVLDIPAYLARVHGNG
jgi:Uma2 family endonuclease